MPDLGLTHIALPVKDLEASVEFYSRFAKMQVIHRREDAAHGTRVVWISDKTRPFVLVLLEGPDFQPKPANFHLGVGCASREEVDRLCTLAREENRKVSAPEDAGYPVGYFAIISDPDGYSLEVSFGQEVGFQVGSNA
jgi:Lactoylglutathione lyase and related lyases